MIKIILLVYLLTAFGCSTFYIDKKQKVEKDEISGVIRLKEFDIPLSEFMSNQSKKSLVKQTKLMEEYTKNTNKCDSLFEVSLEKIPRIRECNRNNYYQSPHYRQLIERYPVQIKSVMNLESNTFWSETERNTDESMRLRRVVLRSFYRSSSQMR